MSDLDGRSFKVIKRHLVPDNIMSEEFVETLGEGKTVMVTVRKPRNPQQHNLVFLLLGMVLEQTDRWETMEQLLDDVKFVTGHYTRRLNALTGEEFVVLKSISFASMDQTKFQLWFDKVVEKLAVDALGIEKDELTRQLMDALEYRNGRVR
jgi:hypothetical protein